MYSLYVSDNRYILPVHYGTVTSEYSTYGDNIGKVTHSPIIWTISTDMWVLLGNYGVA